MTTGEPDTNAVPHRGGSGWLTAFFTLDWLLLLLGVPALVLLGALQDLHLAGSTPEPGGAQAQRTMWVVAFAVAVLLPALGLAAALVFRRRFAGWAFGVTLLLVVCGSMAPTNGSETRPNSLVEWVFKGEGPYPSPYPEDPPVGCFGDSPADDGNPRCKGG
ncbi:hypothetical protein [Phytomonospora endophytica]|uniref:Uncharacterized protein n=1 Tax=Phytomonospora endophytica TaxID=714109 RepID=A0A841FEV6_9ACTN|nr:hypothetical protein [Phytomonospora endophytica]MBB6034374.1 hypothetical protein [Phytomonospora endophytica]GIG66767.1 hypothetical protein Pen01_30620 [Phytomonospora endophytica]